MSNSTADGVKRVVTDRPSRDPKDHPARIPEDAVPHPVAPARTMTRRVRVRVIRTVQSR
jgi:hypothetical protein